MLPRVSVAVVAVAVAVAVTLEVAVGVFAGAVGVAPLETPAVCFDCAASAINL